MTRNQKGIGIGGLLVLGAAAYGIIKYSKMSEEEKSRLVGDLKDKGKKFFDENVPEGLKNIFKKEEPTMNGYTHARV